MLRIEHTGLDIALGILVKLDIAGSFVGVATAHDVEYGRAGFPV